MTKVSRTWLGSLKIFWIPASRMETISDSLSASGVTDKKKPNETPRPSTEVLNPLTLELVTPLGFRKPLSNPAHNFCVGHPHPLSISTFPEVRAIAKVNHRRNSCMSNPNDGNIAARSRHHLGPDG